MPPPDSTRSGLWEFKLPHDDEANIALLREHGLRVAVCVPEVPSVLPLAIPGMEGPPGVADRIEALQASVARLAAYEPECVACLAGPLGGRSEQEATEILARGAPERRQRRPVSPAFASGSSRCT